MQNQIYLPARATSKEACDYLQAETGEAWTLARMIEHGLTPWFWLDYQPGWPDTLFNGRTEGYLAPLCFAGDTNRLAAGGADVLVTMTRTHDGAMIKLGPPPAPVFSTDELRFLREDVKRLAGKFTPQVAPAAALSGDDWKANARRIGERIHKAKTSLSVNRIAEKTHQEMTDIKARGEPGMTGRGGKVPSVDTIKRHALTGIKA